MAEYSRTKTDGDILYDGDWNQVYGDFFRCYAQNLYNLDYDSDITIVSRLLRQTDNWLIGYSILSSSSEYDSASSGSNVQFSNYTGIFIALDYDDFGDAAIDPNKWDTATTGGGSVSEGAGLLIIDADDVSTAYAMTDAVNTYNFKNGFSSFLVDITGAVKSGSGVCKIYISDGTNNVNLFDIANGYQGIVEIQIDPSNTRARYRDKSAGDKTSSWSEWSSWVDCSTATGSNWSIKFYASANVISDAAHFSLVECWYVQNAAISTNNIAYSNVAEHYNSSFTGSTAILVANTELQGGSMALELSTNNAINYTSVSEGQITAISNAGYQAKAKFTITTASGKISYLTEFAYKIWD